MQLKIGIMRKFILFSILFVILILLLSSPLFSNDSGSVFIRKGEYKKAINYYETEIDNLSASELNNIGVAYYKFGSLGKAIYYTIKSLKVKNDFQPARKNLSIYRKQLPDNFKPLNTLSLFGFITENININLILSLAICGILLIIILLVTNVKYKYILIVLLITYELLLNGALFSIGKDKNILYGVTIEQISVLEGPGNEFIEKIKAPEGAEFHIIECENDFIKVKFFNGFIGWVNSSYTKTINYQ